MLTDGVPSNIKERRAAGLSVAVVPFAGPRHAAALSALRGGLLSKTREDASSLTANPLLHRTVRVAVDRM